MHWKIKLVIGRPNHATLVKALNRNVKIKINYKNLVETCKVNARDIKLTQCMLRRRPEMKLNQENKGREFC